MHEKRFNPYYGYVATKLCEQSKGFRLTFLYAFWDLMRSAPSTPHGRLNAALLLRQLVSEGHLDLTVFKPVDWLQDLDVNLRDMVNAFFAHLIADPILCSNDKLRDIFHVRLSPFVSESALTTRLCFI